jgi:uncharacterized protein YndB with AHSA1/START domain
MKNKKDNAEPIQQSVHVDCPVEETFRLFTERFRDWWPGDQSGRNLVESGAITVWDLPDRIEFTWRPDDTQTVTADFRVEADGTQVTITHVGWNHAGAAQCAATFGRFVCEQMLVAF